MLLNARAVSSNPTLQTLILNQLENVTVTRVDHVVQILQGGSVAINDTVQLSATHNTTLTGYPLGFPYRYSQNLAYVYAFNTSNPSQTFNISLDTGLSNSVGYYGVMVIFPQSGIQLYVNGPSFRFTVVFVFSNLIVSSTTTTVTESTPTSGGKPTFSNATTPITTMYYPTFPSLLQNASMANVTVVTPPGQDYEGSSGNLVLNIKKTTSTIQVANLTVTSLPALTNTPGWLNFTASSTGATYQIITTDDLARQVEIGGQGNILVTDTYTVTSYVSQAVSSLQVSLSTGASSVTASDMWGNFLAPTLVDKNTTTYSLSLVVPLEPRNTTQFTVNYDLPSNYVSKTGSQFNVNLPITSILVSTVGKLTYKISFPEGASIVQYPSIKGYELQKGALQQSILLTAYNVSSYNNLNLETAYVYSVFWFSYLPTLWMSAFVGIGVVVALIWERPKLSLPSTAPRVAAKPQTLKSIVASYEERARIQRELESIERQVQKGRMPRGRYKMRRRMLEGQLNRLDRELVDLKESAKSAGPKYAEILKTLDIAEAELEGVEAEGKRVEARYKSGTLSLDAYRHQQDQLNKRREKAKTTIDGELLRLSEETA
jgi:PBP1b-binding outer membrane lipoprotein LpoB